MFVDFLINVLYPGCLSNQVCLAHLVASKAWIPLSNLIVPTRAHAEKFARVGSISLGER